MVDFTAGNQVDNTQQQELITKINGMCESLSGEYNVVSCSPVFGNIGEDECVEVENTVDSGNENIGAIIDQKLILITVSPNLDFTISGSEENNPPRPYYRIVIKCGDSTIATTSNNYSSDPSSLQFIAECPRNEPIQICLEGGITGGSFTARSNSSARICGGILCVGSVRRQNTGIFKIPELNPDCCNGREFLCLAAQNVCAISEELIRNRDQLVRCVSDDITGPGNTVLEGNLDTQSEYVVIGQIEVCYRNNDEERDYIVNINPGIGCASSPADCVSYSGSVPRNPTSSTAPTVCVTIPVYTCGVCPAGDSILAGMTITEDCVEDEVAIESNGALEIISIEQSYCAWIFNRADVSAVPQPLNFSLGRCLTESVMLPLQEKCEQLQEFINNRTPPNLTTRVRNQADAVGSSIVLMQEALPWPPAAPLPRPIPDPPPVKKWTMNICVSVFYDGDMRQYFNNTDLVYGLFSLEIKCGGTIIGSSGPTNWLIRQFEGSDKDDVRDYEYRQLYFTGCVECAIDEDLTVEVTAVANSLLGSSRDIGIRFERASMFCF